MKAKAKADRDLQYLLFKRDELGASRINPGGEVWRLHWYCMDDGTHWVTDVDSSMNNFLRSNWPEVVYHPAPWGVYRNLRRTATRQTWIYDDAVISADSRWVCEQHNTEQDVFETIQALEPIYYPAKQTHFQGLFA